MAHFGTLDPLAKATPFVFFDQTDNRMWRRNLAGQQAAIFAALAHAKRRPFNRYRRVVVFSGVRMVKEACLGIVYLERPSYPVWVKVEVNN